MKTIRRFRNSLFGTVPASRLRSLDIDILLFLSMVSLWAGFSAPLMTFKKLFFFKNTFSLFSGLNALFNSREYFLFAVIFIFSVLFPNLKLIFLGYIRYFSPRPSAKTEQYLRRLGALGRFSMLDVFVAAMLVVFVRLGVLGKVESRWGLYVFTVSVLLSIVTSIRMEAFNRKCLSACSTED